MKYVPLILTCAVILFIAFIVFLACLPARKPKQRSLPPSFNELARSNKEFLT